MIALIAGFAITYAKQEREGKGEKNEWGKGKLEKGKGIAAPLGKSPGMKYWQKLNLTDEQKEKIKAAKLQFMKETLPIRNELSIKKIELQELWSAEEPDAKKIIAKQKEINDLTAKLSEKMVYHRIEMSKILTPEQKQMMKKGMGAMKMSRGKDGFGGYGMGMQGGMGCCAGMGAGKGQTGMGKHMNPECPMMK
ncbi:MAG: Spy/CpxP family protein refolding chaperone [bacterium]|nr:Spy/CpxP family protein refolding chaperone [bacterium]